ncbi:hypothetical protein KORDIASMS9_02557 [Kordia sp. SMS9]|uniref:hypothetical protein n=1 Tax=Kordia sp. SMS9 TaxID=2282170 RepID=UPI000E1047DF|nr:hypothetical protein [Kordia sp. SMS9]AXG70318.1 hypothetical protein KORDIASMS9_02557 [Kordia sp. SMS9]
MKKRKLKNLDLKKKSISNLSQKQVQGGAVPTTVTILSCWSCISCPTIDCTEGVVCDFIRSETPH